MKQSAILMALLAVLAWPMPARALIHLDDQGTRLAVRYGLENKSLGYSSFLGGNWQEGDNGTLLNIYSPFMQVADKYLRTELPDHPGEADVKKAIERYSHQIQNIKHDDLVKFLVSFYGDTPSFARKFNAYIEVRDKAGKLQQRILPERQVQQYYGQKDAGGDGKSYSAINTYSFKFEDLAKLKRYTFVMVDQAKESTHPPAVFVIDNDRIY